jgi:hypothetical protein
VGPGRAGAGVRRRGELYPGAAGHHEQPQQRRLQGRARAAATPGCIDWTYSKEPVNRAIFDDQKVDVALIFPKAWCVKHGCRDRMDSIVNKTMLTHRSRRIMGNQAPDAYLRQLEAEAGLPGNWLDDIVGTHLVDAQYLRHGPDFDGFYADRSAKLLELIHEAMGVQPESDSGGQGQEQP